MSWSIERGAPSRINAIAQSKDGYLWIGSVEGLFRFDGVTFEPIIPEDPRSSKLVVAEVLGARSGDVWVGLARSGGVRVYRGGRLIDAAMPHPSREVTDLAEDPAGGVWVARGGRTRDTLARYWRGHWQEVGSDWGLPKGEVWQIRFTRNGSMWVVLTDTVVRRLPGASHFEPTGARIERRSSLAEDAQGRLWVSDTRGTRMLTAATPPSARRTYSHAQEIGGTRILFDQHGALWGATWTDGIFRISRPGPGAASDPRQVAAAETFKAPNGLTSDQTHSVFEDREGNIWVGTELGLDMLRPASVVAEPAIPANSPSSYRMATTTDGAVYIADAHALYVIPPGEAPKVVLRTVGPLAALCAGRDNAVWVTLPTALVRIKDGRSKAFPRPPGDKDFGCAEDHDGRLWLPELDKGLFWLKDGRWRQWPGLSPKTGLPANAAVGRDGRAVILFRSPPPVSPVPPFEALFKERFQVGAIEGVLPGQAELYVGGGLGLARIARGQIRHLDADAYPWIASVNGLVQTPAGVTWTIGDAGIVRMRTAELNHAFDNPGSPLDHRTFDFRDGLNSFVQKSPGPQIAMGGDGRLWILTRRNVVRIDPAHLNANPLPPPVSIRALSVGNQRYRDPVSIKAPPGTTDLTIDYTALSLSVPDRVRFRYRLVGVDRDWVDAGNRREVVYNHLHPGSWRFEVKAANDDGVWNESGAALGVTIPPTLTETWPFRVAAIFVAALLLWAIYALRLRQVAGRIRDRLEERASERERIARELHDTLLQSVQGLIMRFQAVADHIGNDQPAKDVINRALDRADQMLVEGRDRVRDLRRLDPRRLDVILRELALEQPFAETTHVDLATEGMPRDIRAGVHEEIVRICGEALFNAARHARARHVQVKIAYGLRRLQIIIQDNGVGLGANRATWAGRDGHYGLIGMRERARRIGAQLSVESEDGDGTQVRLSIPSSLAYLSPPLSTRLARTLVRWRRAGRKSELD